MLSGSFLSTTNSWTSKGSIIIIITSQFWEIINSGSCSYNVFICWAISLLSFSRASAINFFNSTEVLVSIALIQDVMNLVQKCGKSNNQDEISVDRITHMILVLNTRIMCDAMLKTHQVW
ncbi:hypothetical protein HanRHA438_Chr06g0250191 [Helianthus annuus]|nr:hypothetical protein HanRHA438_Chr06g0250191 [Helianthus annuus]